MSEHLDEFFVMYILPNYDETTLFTYRKQIRESKHLNKFLHDNREGLRLIYELYKSEESNTFTV